MPDTPNYDDANFALRLYEIRRETELRKARSMVGELLDGAPWETFAAVMDYSHPENAHFRQVTTFWAMCASFVNRGIFHPDVFLDTCGEALYMYSVFQPHLPRLREQNPMFMAQIQRLVDEHPAMKERLAAIDASRAAWQAKDAAAKVAKAEAAAAKRGGRSGGASKAATKPAAKRAGARAPARASR